MAVNAIAKGIDSAFRNAMVLIETAPWIFDLVWLLMHIADLAQYLNTA